MSPWPVQPPADPAREVLVPGALPLPPVGASRACCSAPRERQDEERSAFGTGYGETDLVT